MKYSALGYSSVPQLKKYILWTLKLLQDMPSIIKKTNFTDDFIKVS